VPRTALVALAAAAVLSSAGCAAGLLPPSRTDLGSTVITDGGQLASGFRFSTGVHLASATLRRDVPLDVGAGYVFERFGAASSSGEAVSRRAGGPGDVNGADGADIDHADAHGGYLEVAHTVDRGRGHRAWLGARGELLARQTPDGRHATAGAFGRVAWEVFSTGQGGGTFSSGCGGGAGFARGAVGLGLFVESGAQWTAEQSTAFVATAGLSLRLPLLGGFIFDLCPSC